MQPQDLREHRAGIVSEVRVVLSAYFQPSETADIITAQLAWWADELHDWTREQVVWALRNWNRDEPSKRPTPGHILSILKRQRGLMEAKRNPPPRVADDRPAPATAEEAARIMEEAGYPARKFGNREAAE